MLLLLLLLLLCCRCCWAAAACVRSTSNERSTSILCGGVRVGGDNVAGVGAARCCQDALQHLVKCMETLVLCERAGDAPTGHVGLSSAECGVSPLELAVQVLAAAPVLRNVSKVVVGDDDD